VWGGPSAHVTRLLSGARRIAYPPIGMVVRRVGPLIAAAAISTATMLARHDAVAAEAAVPSLVRYQDDALSVHVTGVPLSEVLAEVGRQSGAEIRGQLRETRDVQADFETVP